MLNNRHLDVMHCGCKNVKMKFISLHFTILHVGLFCHQFLSFYTYFSSFPICHYNLVETGKFFKLILAVILSPTCCKQSDLHLYLHTS